MKKLLFLLILASVSFSGCQKENASIPSGGNGHACTGSANCRVCKNCKYCKHCAKDDGTCGVCK